MVVRPVAGAEDELRQANGLVRVVKAQALDWIVVDGVHGRPSIVLSRELHRFEMPYNNATETVHDIPNYPKRSSVDLACVAMGSVRVSSEAYLAQHFLPVLHFRLKIDVYVAVRYITSFSTAVSSKKFCLKRRSDG